MARVETPNKIPLWTFDEKSRKILISETNKLRSLVKPLDVNSFKRKFFRHNSWGWSYRARAALLSYEISREKEHIEAVLDGASYFSKLNEWETWEKSSGKWFSEVTTAGLIATPIADLLLLANKDESARELVAGQYRSLMDSVINGVSGFDHIFRTIDDSGYFLTPLDKNRVEALNHMAVYVAALSRLYELTKDEKYRERVAEITRFWLSSTTLHDNNSLSWPYSPSPVEMHGIAENFWKASVTIEIPIAAYRIGVVVTPEHLLQLQRTLTHNLFSDGYFKEMVNRIDGAVYVKSQTQIDRRRQRQREKASVLSMWHMLDCYLTPTITLDDELFRIDKNFFNSTSRSLYGVVSGLYAREGLCKDTLTRR